MLRFPCCTNSIKVGEKDNDILNKYLINFLPIALAIWKEINFKKAEYIYYNIKIKTIFGNL